MEDAEKLLAEITEARDQNQRKIKQQIPFEHKVRIAKEFYLEDRKERDELVKVKDAASSDNRHVFLKDDEDVDEEEVAGFDIPDDPNPFKQTT